MKNRKLFALIFIILYGILFSSCKKDLDAGNLDASNVRKEGDLIQVVSAENSGVSSVVNFDFLPSSTTNQVVQHKYYTLSYNEAHEQAEWVAYELKKNYIKNNNFKRPFFY